MMQLSPGARTPPIKVEKNPAIIYVLKTADCVVGVRSKKYRIKSVSQLHWSQ
jgi:hypothetical protein